jgi:hypothetical protein
MTSIGGQVGWTSFSDGRFKENIREDVPGLAFVSQLRPVTYRVDRERIDEFTGAKAWREQMKREHRGFKDVDRERFSSVTTGFIAQEVEEAATKCGFEFSGVDAPQNDHGLYGLRYGEFVVPLVKAVQEQQKLIEELQKQNAALVQRIEALEKK